MRDNGAALNEAASAAPRLPSWLKVRLPTGENFLRVRGLAAKNGLSTVCTEARCPNIGECWDGGTATFMVMGELCTRGCRFCSVGTAARPPAPDPAEPRKLAESVAALGLRYAVLTTVCRDDLADQGAGHIAACIRSVKALSPKTLVEFLIQDFRGREEPLKTVLDAGPDVLSHNLETVERLTPRVRDAKAGYGQSLGVLRAALRLRPGVPTKSSLMLGLGETPEELLAALRDLRGAGVRILTLGQYLRPTRSARHLPVVDYVEPSRFEEYGRLAKGLGFEFVASGPFVRSSYRAAELFLEGQGSTPRIG